jgi:hypothetical protein
MEILVALERSWPAQLIADSIWGFPILEIVHLTGLTVVFGGMTLLDARLMGLRREFSVRTLERYVLGFVWAGFTVAAFSGGWLFVYEATTLAEDPPFLIKMVLIPLAGLNALFMHKVGMRGAEHWDVHAMPPIAVRLSAAVSLLLWASVLACGRLIAYYYP